MMPANELAAVIVKALDAKKGENIQLLKTQDLTTLADYFVICTASSSTHVKTLTDADDAAYRRYRDDVSDYESALKYYYQKLKDEQSQENWEFKNKPRSSGGRGSSREKQPDGDLARLVALAVTGAKKGGEKKRLSSGGKSGS